jgi:AcrR family transcriptional regulator
MDRIIDEIADYAHGRVPRALRERQILAAAEQLFGEEGYARASMDELARRVGVSKPVIYALVGSKEQLYRRCVEAESEQLAERIAVAAGGEADPAGQVRAGVLAFFRFVEEHQRVWEVLAWDSAPFALEAAQIRHRHTDLVTSLIATSAQRLGAELPPREVEVIAHALIGAIEALSRWARDHREATPEQLTEWVVELVLPGLERIVARHQRTTTE